FWQFTLDLSTTTLRHQLSDSNRMVTDKDNQSTYDSSIRSYNSFAYQSTLLQVYKDPQDYYSQVWCNESVIVPCYWEVEWSGNNGVSIAVSYKDMGRMGSNKFGLNDQSWSLQCSSSSCSFLHNNQETKISMKPTYTIGVFLDHKA
ncbi:tripartite motif-containing protein 16-like, partial [Clarias magur]